MPATYGPDGAAYYITTKAPGIRPDTKVEGVCTVQYEDGVLTLTARDGAVLFLAPLAEVVYVKAVEKGGRGE